MTGYTVMGRCVMLSRADASLVRRDPAIPGLATVLDPDALLAELQAIVPGSKLSNAQITYVKYRHGSVCLVGYRIDIAGSSVELSAKAARSDARKPSNDIDSPGPPGPLGPSPFLLPRRSVVVTVFPDDNKLPGLKGWAETATRERLLRELFPDQPQYCTASVRSLRYWPERRYVAQLVADTNEMALLKFYSQSRYEVPQANAQAFVSAGPLRLARELGRSNRHCVLAFEWLPGRGLRDALEQPVDAETPLAVGAALAELHGQKPKALRQLKADGERARLMRVAAEVAFICPRLADRANVLASRLAAHLTQKPAMICPIHNDFHTRQVLLQQQTVAFLDLDEAGWGDPAVDVGNFIAHLELDILRGTLHRGRAGSFADGLKKGYYKATGKPIPRVTTLYVATRLFRRSPIHFRYHVHNWPELTEEMLNRSETFLRTYLTHKAKGASDSLATQ